MACPPFAIAGVNGRKVTPEAEITGTPSGKLNSGGGDGIPHSREYPPHGSLSAAGPRRALQSKFANMMSCEIPNVNPPIVMSKLIGPHPVLASYVKIRRGMSYRRCIGKYNRLNPIM